VADADAAHRAVERLRRIASSSKFPSKRVLVIETSLTVVVVDGPAMTPK
jgi:hypothetical protein